MPSVDIVVTRSVVCVKLTMVHLVFTSLVSTVLYIIDTHGVVLFSGCVIHLCLADGFAPSSFCSALLRVHSVTLRVWK